jgi:hypothetical protein
MSSFLKAMCNGGNTVTKYGRVQLNYIIEFGDVCRDGIVTVCI